MIELSKKEIEEVSGGVCEPEYAAMWAAAADLATCTAGGGNCDGYFASFNIATGVYTDCVMGSSYLPW